MQGPLFIPLPWRSAHRAGWSLFESTGLFSRLLGQYIVIAREQRKATNAGNESTWSGLAGKSPPRQAPPATPPEEGNLPSAGAVIYSPPVEGCP